MNKSEISKDQSINLINDLIETGAFSEYAQVCLIKAMHALNVMPDDAEIADVRARCGDDSRAEGKA